MISFICNICGSHRSVQQIQPESPSCSGCGSNVRIRTLIYMLSRELFGVPTRLVDFPRNPNIKGLGLTDHPSYAVGLAKKCDYVNTYYDRDPFLDITAENRDGYGRYDFILSSDVFEHIPYPVDRAFDECFRLLGPDGLLCITVPSSLEEHTEEHYPNLNVYSTVDLGGERLLVNRRRDGKIEIFERPVFHEGSGPTLEMRLFSRNDLIRKLKSVGFIDVLFQDEDVEEYGIKFEGPWSRPLVARKSISSPPHRLRLAEPAKKYDSERGLFPDRNTEGKDGRIEALEEQLLAVKNSKWVKLGRRLGFGPRLG